MTAHVNRKSSKINSVVSLNIILFCLALLGLGYYVASANSLASHEYKVASLRNQIALLNEAQTKLLADKSAAENPAAAAQFAKAQNMVSAQEIVYIFENGNVALQR